MHYVQHNLLQHWKLNTDVSHDSPVTSRLVTEKTKSFKICISFIHSLEGKFPKVKNERDSLKLAFLLIMQDKITNESHSQSPQTQMTRSSDSVINKNASSNPSPIFELFFMTTTTSNQLEVYKKRQRACFSSINTQKAKGRISDQIKEYREKRVNFWSINTLKAYQTNNPNYEGDFSEMYQLNSTNDKGVYKADKVMKEGHSRAQIIKSQLRAQRRPPRTNLLKHISHITLTIKVRIDKSKNKSYQRKQTFYWRGHVNSFPRHLDPIRMTEWRR